MQHDPDTLTADATWLSGLAHTLLADPQTADDVAQEVWLAALNAEQPRSLRGWMGTVARRAAWRKRRSSDRRARREAAAARPEAVGSTLDVVARAEVHSLLVDAVLRLEDPYKRVLLDRYFDDLSPAEIAAQRGVPAATVRSQLKRGLERLRAELDRSHGGDRAAWCLSLAPVALLALGGGRAAKASTGVAVGAVGLVASAAIVAVLVFAGQDPAPATTPPVPPTPPVAQREAGAKTTPPLPTAADEPASPNPVAADADEPATSTPPTEERIPAPQPEVAPAGVERFSGVVQDPAGAPLAGVRIAADPGFDAQDPDGYAVAHTDSTGAFTLDLEQSATFDVRFTYAGFEPRSFDVDALRARSSITLHPTGEQVLTGRVLLPSGEPAPDAGIYLGKHAASATADPRGRFRLAIPADLLEEIPLVAALPGWRPKILERFATREHPADQELILQLGERPLRLAGRLEDAAGNPLAGWTIRLNDATVVTPGWFPPTTAEQLADPERASFRAETDDEGRFAFGGLEDRTYRVYAYERGNLRWLESDPIRAGDEHAVVRLSADSVRERVGGRVVSRAGVPLAKVDVSVGLTIHDDGKNSSGVATRLGWTDADGRFEVRGVPASGAHLTFSGDGIVPLEVPLNAETPAELTVVVAARCQWKLELAPGVRAPETIEALDAAGERRTIRSISETTSWATRRLHVADDDGRPTQVFTVSEDVVVLRLGFADGTTRELPVRLDPEHVTVVRP